jgi:hypothetical protein
MTDLANERRTGLPNLLPQQSARLAASKIATILAALRRLSDSLHRSCEFYTPRPRPPVISVPSVRSPHLLGTLIARRKRTVGPLLASPKLISVPACQGNTSLHGPISAHRRRSVIR